MTEVGNEIRTIEEVAADLKAGKGRYMALPRREKFWRSSLTVVGAFAAQSRWIVESINKKKPEAE